MNVEASNQIVNLKLLITVFLYPFIKSSIAGLSLSVNIRDIMFEVWMFIYNLRRCRLEGLVPRDYFSRSTICEAMLYLHFIILVLCSLANVYRAGNLVFRPARHLPLINTAIYSEVDAIVLLGSVSMALCLLPMFLPQDLFWRTVLSAAQQVLEVAIYVQFSILLEVVHRAIDEPPLA